MRRIFSFCLMAALAVGFSLSAVAQDKVVKKIIETGKNDNQVMEHINDVMYGVRMDLGLAAAESWIYFGVALAFIGISAFIISRAVKSYE